MTDSGSNPELLRSLGRLVRGLSALFWGLPMALIVCVLTAKTEILRPFSVAPPLVVTAWVCFGLWQLGHFQKQERVWIGTLDKTKMLGVVNLGLSPFLYWWSQLPGNAFFTIIAAIMALCGLAFLANLNLLLNRLSAMLPDEHLREETRHFTTMNRYLVLGILLLAAGLVGAQHFPEFTESSSMVVYLINTNGLLLMVFLVLLPLAMTMALLWKIKEVILDGVFGPGR